jgi:large subunit ribosomal protein L25
MKSFEIKAAVRNSLGKKDSKKTRDAGNVPCILYGGKSNINFTVDEKEVSHVIFTPNVYLVNLNIDGKTYSAKIHDIQFHPVTDRVNHIDFYEVLEDKKITIDLPVKIQGNSIGVREGGKLIQDRRKVKVRALVKDMPDEIVLDITDLNIGKAIRVGDLSFKNIEFLDLKTSPVVSVKVTRASRGTAAEEAAATTGTAAPAATPAATPAAK